MFEFAFHGFEATLSEADVQAMLASDDVIRLHPVQAMTLQDARIALPSLDPALPWGLDRIDQEAFPLDGRYLGKRKGAGVDVYVLDSGIRADHVEFGGRARVVLDTTGETREPPQDDCNGHGTHVAGTAAGATVGVAPAANIIGMKVYSCATGGSDARLLAAFEWLLKNARTPAVVNVSLAGEEPGPSDAAIARLREKGIAVVVGAANSFDDACKFSPARVPEAITVGASSQTIDFEGNLIDSLAFFSNYGTCVDILAPGTQIRSAWKNGTDSYAGLDGTSMATPHVTGALALMLEDNPRMNVDALESRLYETAFKGRIEFSLGDRGTPRRLLNTLWNSTR